MKLVIFDFDGVIVDTFEMAMQINALITPTLTEDEYRNYFRCNFYSEQIKGAVKISENKINFFDEYSKKIQSKTTEEIIKNQIKELSGRYLVVIVSSTASSAIKNYLVKENLDKYFLKIYGSDIDTSKVVKIKRLLNEYKLEPKDAIFITDTTGDIKEGRECGVESIAVTWGFLPKEELVGENPLAVIDEPALIKETVDNYFSKE